MKRIEFLQATAAVLFLAATTTTLAQGGYPNRPIRLIVPFPAGGATDLFARTLSLKMGEKLGTTLVIDNKPGAGGAIGSDMAAKAPPDGYTLLLATTSTHSIGPFIGKVPYDTVRDFTPIAHVGNAPSIMLVPNSSPAKTVSAFSAGSSARAWSASTSAKRTPVSRSTCRPGCAMRRSFSDRSSIR